MTYLVLVTGSREWRDETVIYNALFRVGYECHLGGVKVSDITVMHGGAKGADRIAGSVATRLGMAVKVFPADWERYGAKAGPRRNMEMVVRRPNVVLAFPLGVGKGTRHCMAEAAKYGIEIRNYGFEAP